MQDAQKKNCRRAWFWVPFFVTISILIFLIAVIIVDVRCRRMGLGDMTPPISFSTALGDRTLMEYHILWFQGEVDLTIVDNLVEYVEEKLQEVISVLSNGKN